MTKRLVFGDDGSNSADSAWLWITSHNWPGWTVEVVSVDGEAPFHSREFSGNTDVSIHETRLSGKPSERIREVGADADLIVIGAKGRGWRKAVHLGSTAENLMHSPPAPVTIIRRGHRTQRLLLAIDGSEYARQTEESVANLPWIGSVEVGIIAVPEEGKQIAAIWEAEKRLVRVARSVTAQVVEPDEMQAFYRPSDVILEASKKWNADLVALGSRGLSRWETAAEVGLRRAGSCAIAVAQSAISNVLLGKVER